MRTETRHLGLSSKWVGMLNIIDEFTRECLVIGVARKLKGTDV